MDETRIPGTRRRWGEIQFLIIVQLKLCTKFVENYVTIKNRKPLPPVRNLHNKKVNRTIKVTTNFESLIRY
jgi:hypothetical protein